MSFSIFQAVEQTAFPEKVLEMNDLVAKLSFFDTDEATSGVDASVVDDSVVDDGGCRDVGSEPEAAGDGVALPGILDGLLDSIDDGLNGLLPTL